uniref:Uncharacterized protein n=1 Tax=Pinctada fucata TaxID=50426 RepID=A0A194ANA0_PINFU
MIRTSLKDCLLFGSLLSFMSFLINATASMEYSCEMKETSECAKTQNEFQRRADQFNCKNSFYTCILTSDNLLVETCASIYNIPSSAKDCPVITCGSRGVGLSKSSVAYCPENIPGCPNGNRFNTSCLYMYPKCLLRLQDRFTSKESRELSSSTNSSVYTTLEEIKKSLSNYHNFSIFHLCSILNSFLLFLLVIIVWVYRIKLLENKRKDKKSINEMDI